jgi:xanthine/CO dehydrogenase XdhC/CoxF family maturation factor
MRDIIPELKKWLAAGRHDIALATIVETRGSSCVRREPAWRSPEGARSSAR